MKKNILKKREAKSRKGQVANEQQSEISQLLQHLAPWIEKTNGMESVGDWEMTLGTKMVFRSATATQHFKIVCKMLKEDMPTLMFAGHMKYMIRRYGPKKSKK